MKWKKYTLEECCVSIADGDHQAPPKADNGVPFITISNIDSSNRLDFSRCNYVPFDYYDNIAEKRKAQQNDILYSVVGSFGIPVFIDRDMEFVFQRHIAILRPNSEIVNPRFLYYAMKSKEFYLQADTVALGAAQRTISLSSLKKMTTCLPPLPAQNIIVRQLSAYDDLIENNQKQIKLLEEAAQRLYKEWFVDLCFPGHENVKIVDGVPDGWHKSKVESVIGGIKRKKKVKAIEYSNAGGIPVIDQGEDFIGGYTDDESALIRIKEPVIVFGDHTRRLKLVQFDFASGADGTQIITALNPEMPIRLLYCSLINVDLSNYSYARHFKYLKEEIVVVPSTEVADMFEEIASGLFCKIQKLRDEITILQEARDRLLPKLMSGEIEV